MTQRITIIGGGAVGSAIAYFLTQQTTAQTLEVCVLERDFAYRQASSALSASSIRQQYSSVINIQLSQFGIGFLRTLGQTLHVDGQAPNIGLTEPGYLYLASPEGSPILRENHALQKQWGVDVALLEPAALQAKFPWLATDGLALASLGLSGEGWFDGYGLMQALRKRASAQGVRYLQAEATGLRRTGRHISGVQLNSGETLPCDVVVNAAGPWAAKVAAWVDIDLPVRARRRSVYSFSCPTPLPACPLVIDRSGIWFRPEGQQFICGYPPLPCEDLDDLPLDEVPDVFESTLWPILAERVPAFEALRLHSAWAGYYEMNVFDHNAILGLHPDCTNLYFANGFSGHGLQQCPAVGRGIAELIRYGSYRSLDLSPLGFERILQNQPLLERNVI